MMAFCHNCGHYAQLDQVALCTYCITFFYAHSRLPLHTDPVEPLDSLATLYSRMGWS